MYVYESGTGYGSSVINFEKKPLITIKNGKNAQLKPIIINGLLNSVNIQFGGSEYFSIPDIKVVDSEWIWIWCYIKTSCVNVRKNNRC